MHGGRGGVALEEPLRERPFEFMHAMAQLCYKTWRIPRLLMSMWKSRDKTGSKIDIRRTCYTVYLAVFGGVSSGSESIATRWTRTRLSC
jgi:hypothetical protein